MERRVAPFAADMSVNHSIIVESPASDMRSSQGSKFCSPPANLVPTDNLLSPLGVGLSPPAPPPAKPALPATGGPDKGAAKSVEDLLKEEVSARERIHQIAESQKQENKQLHRERLSTEEGGVEAAKAAAMAAAEGLQKSRPPSAALPPPTVMGVVTSDDDVAHFILQSAQQNAIRGLQTQESGDGQSPAGDLDAETDGKPGLRDSTSLPLEERLKRRAQRVSIDPNAAKPPPPPRPPSGGAKPERRQSSLATRSTADIVAERLSSRT